MHLDHVDVLAEVKPKSAITRNRSNYGNFVWFRTAQPKDMIHGILHARYGFYRLLPEADQLVFQKRVQDFLKGRQFRAKDNQPITDEQKVIIAAPAIHLTWGFRKFYFPYFNLITIFHESYADLSVKRYSPNGVHMTGAVVVTWPEWEWATGVNFPMNFQPGIHEFALAMYEENVTHAEGYAAIQPEWIEAQLDRSGNLVERLPAEWKAARKATATVPQQWFATASEHFLSNPETFHHTYPDLYSHISQIYQWDPMNVPGPQTLNT